MASIILGSVGKMIGNTAGGPFGAFVGARVGQLVGGWVDNKLVGGSGGSTTRQVEGARLEDLAVQTSTYGRVVPTVYGTVRIGGNVIWARPIKELVTTTSSTTTTGGGGKGGGGGGRSSSQTTVTTTYSYSATLAVAICEGQIDRINRMWADAKLLSVGQYTMRVYDGSETQLPDPLLESYLGAAPAHRGMAYVVIEDFPLGEFGNRIPNFSFEVTRKVLDTASAVPAENMVTAITLIPGSGEFVYDTVVQSKAVGEEVGGQWVQRGNQVTLNMHNVNNRANVLLALDQMQQTFPNLEWVSVVVNWFGSSVDAGGCIVEPCVEFGNVTRVTPNEWQVGGLTRATARVISYDGGSPRYGGTPSDAGVVRLVQELRARGIKVFFYPMMLMDVAGKPWRGELTGSASSVSSFFTKTNGYNAFVLHYANLVDGLVDAFAIGSELRGLTKVSASAGVYPAVTQLVSLAASVKGILGSGVKITYAADWSEYHHTDGGWYNLDPLWASSNIDVIGIDAYFPLTDGPQEGIDKQAIKDGWTSGEGYDFYYSDEGRTTQAALGEAYAWKNMAWWWSNHHVNPDSSTTDWIPESKKIWFTEYGFASVDGTTNEPNRFVDPSTGDSGFPRFSKGRVDFAIQRAAIEATEEVWAASDMVEEKFLWTWDARPYSQWPDLSGVWSDGINWATGHWVQGKLGNANLAGIVRAIARKSGVADEKLDCGVLTQSVEGFVIHQRQSARAAFDELMTAYPFDLVESGDVLKAVRRGQVAQIALEEEVCLPVTEEEQRITLQTVRGQELELPKEMEIIYLNRLDGYNAATQRASWQTAASRTQVALKLSLVLSDQAAKVVADAQLWQRWLARTRYRFQLPIRYAMLEPGDVIALSARGAVHTMRIDQVQFGKPGMLRVDAVAEDPQIYEEHTPVVTPGAEPVHSNEVSKTRFEVMDLPLLPGDALNEATLRFAAVGVAANWPGCSIYQLKSSGDELLLTHDLPAVMGSVVNVLPVEAAQRWDVSSTLDVVLLGEGTLASATEAEVLNGANAALVGNEIIQFTTAEALEEGKYRLSGLLRGRLGTEEAIAGHVAGERFVLLDGAVGTYVLQPAALGRQIDLEAASFGDVVEPDEAIAFIPTLRSLKPYAPVHVSAVRAGNDITLHWVRRTRQNGDWRDYQDVPLNEVDERYDVEVLNGANVVRSFRVTTPTQAYTEAQQIGDFGSAQASLKVRIMQLSTLAGRGMAAEAFV